MIELSAKLVTALPRQDCLWLIERAIGRVDGIQRPAQNNSPPLPHMSAPLIIGDGKADALIVPDSVRDSVEHLKQGCSCWSVTELAGSIEVAARIGADRVVATQGHDPERIAEDEGVARRIAAACQPWLVPKPQG